MATINILSHDTIDKIAAGEVVERPANVVKELVENSIDAKATAVTVEIKDGGTTFIRVTDNGNGIEKSQIRNAFLRHATSKIHKVEDLTELMSLGFRGEALSSISAVSKVELITKTPDEFIGVRALLNGNEDADIEDVGAPDGTTIVVRNLFFNTPVRRKFLKSVQAETGAISDLMERIALSHPEVSFKYMVNGNDKFQTNGNGDLAEIVYRIYGRDIARELIPVNVNENGISMKGLLGKPSITRASRNFENYFVNGRYIKSEIISKSIEDAYNPYLMQHKYPFIVLSFCINSKDVDVNVHPAKMEVRFSNREKIAEFIRGKVSEALEEKEMIPEVSLMTDKEIHQEEKAFKVEQNREFKKEKAPEPFETVRILESHVKEATSNYGVNIHENIHENVIKSSEHIFVEKPAQMDLFEEKLLTREAKSEYQILGQVFDTYWIVGFHDKLFFIDQHAAHEKVKYERFIKRMNENNAVSQQVNPPVIVTLSGKEEAAFKQYADIFVELGFEIEEFGGNEYAIRSIPIEVYGVNEKTLFLEVMDEILEGSMNDAPLVIRNKIASMSCKAAVKGGQALSVEEAKALIDELLELDNPYHCPHGRPTIVSMSRYEIEKKFKRIV